MGRRYPKVLVSLDCEHFPGQEVYILDYMPGEELDCCVCPKDSALAISECEWVSARHLTPSPDPHLATSKGRRTIRPDTPLAVGDPVVARDVEHFTISLEVGYISEMDESMVGIATSREGETEILVKKHFVTHS